MRGSVIVTYHIPCECWLHPWASSSLKHLRKLTPLMEMVRGRKCCKRIMYDHVLKHPEPHCNSFVPHPWFMLSSWCVAPMALGDPTSRMRQLRLLKGRCKIVWGRSFPGQLQVRSARFPFAQFRCSQINVFTLANYKEFLHLEALRWAAGRSGQPRLILCSRNLPVLNWGALSCTCIAKPSKVVAHAKGWCKSSWSHLWPEPTL